MFFGRKSQVRETLRDIIGSGCLGSRAGAARADPACQMTDIIQR
jgi:hypothetical protein